MIEPKSEPGCARSETTVLHFLVARCIIRPHSVISGADAGFRVTCLTVINPMKMFPYRLTSVGDQPFLLFLCQLEIERAHSRCVDQDRILLQLFVQCKYRRLHPLKYGCQTFDILQRLAIAEISVFLVFRRHHRRSGKRQAKCVINLALAKPHQREIKDCPAIYENLTFDFGRCEKQWHGDGSTNSVSKRYIFRFSV